MKSRILTYLIVSALIIFSSVNCRSTKEKKVFDTKTVSIKIFDIPPGADPNVPAEQGGSGFKGEGWETKTDVNIAGNPNATKGGSLVIAIKAFPATLRIIGKDANYQFNVMTKGLIYETLLGQDPVTDEYIPSLATHWKIMDDKKTFKFRINPDARWADGNAVTTEDVIATYKLLADSTTLDPLTVESMKRFEPPVAESKYIFNIKAKELDFRLFYEFATTFYILPSYYIKTLSGKDYLDQYQFKYIPGSGPYLIDSNDVKKGQSISVRRRSDYWAEKEKQNTGLYNFDYIKFDIIGDDALLFEKFKKGEIDIIEVTSAKRWSEQFDFDEYNRGLILKRKIYNEYPRGVQGLTMNMRKPPFDDIKIRKAFCYAYNRMQFNEKLFYNLYVPLASYFPGTEFANPENPLTGFNLDSAKMLLEEAGWKDKNSEGYLVKDGKVFQTELPFIQGMDRYLTIFQEDLKKIGIKLNLKEIDGPTLFKLGNERNFTLLPINWTGPRVPNPTGMMESRMADIPNTTNWPGIKDKRIDELLQKYLETFSLKERVKILREIDYIACNIYAYIFEWYAPFQRIAYQNKFGYPEGIIGKYSDFLTATSMWYNDGEKAALYDKAVLDKNITIPSGEVDNKYWLQQK